MQAIEMDERKSPQIRVMIKDKPQWRIIVTHTHPRFEIRRAAPSMRNLPAKKINTHTCDMFDRA